MPAQPVFQDGTGGAATPASNTGRRTGIKLVRLNQDARSSADTRVAAPSTTSGARCTHPSDPASVTVKR